MFNAATFDPANAPEDWTLVFDQSGIISSKYPYSGTPASNGDTPEWALSWLGGSLYNAGYITDYPAFQAEWLGATFHEGQNHAVFYSDGNGGGTSTYFIDNGIMGTSGQDVIFDYTGDNIVDGAGGDDLIMVGGGNDAVAGGDGNDEIYTSVGNDIVDAGAGDDLVYLMGDDDRARGGSGADTIFGEDGNDRIWGQQGHDHLDGGNGDDKLRGNGGRDTLIGGAGEDDLRGGGGHDRLEGGTGADTLTGNNGRDTFVFGLGDGADTITDFAPGQDTIELDMALAADFQALGAFDTQVGNDLVLDFGNGDTLTLENTSWSDLDPGDFDFA